MMKKELEQVLADIEKYKQVDEVILIGVSKTQTMDNIKKLVDLGVSHLGENRPQELRDKYDLHEVDVNWHMIGRLQSNKIKYVINRACLIHSVASQELMQQINKEAAKHNKIMDILLQVNTANEDSKQGFASEEDLKDALMFAKELNNISVKGLMCMAPLEETNLEVVEETFRKAKALYDKYHDNFIYLSMGMSIDYQIALKHGANMLRIGSLLFKED